MAVAGIERRPAGTAESIWQNAYMQNGITAGAQAGRQNRQVHPPRTAGGRQAGAAWQAIQTVVESAATAGNPGTPGVPAAGNEICRQKTAGSRKRRQVVGRTAGREFRTGSRNVHPTQKR